MQSPIIGKIHLLIKLGVPRSIVMSKECKACKFIVFVKLYEKQSFKNRFQDCKNPLGNVRTHPSKLLVGEHFVRVCR